MLKQLFFLQNKTNHSLQHSLISSLILLLPTHAFCQHTRTHTHTQTYKCIHRPDPTAMVQELDSMGMKVMVTVWPWSHNGSMSYDKMLKEGWLTQAINGTVNNTHTRSTAPNCAHIKSHRGWGGSGEDGGDGAEMACQSSAFPAPASSPLHPSACIMRDAALHGWCLQSPRRNASFLVSRVVCFTRLSPVKPATHWLGIARGREASRIPWTRQLSCQAIRPLNAA